MIWGHSPLQALARAVDLLIQSVRWAAAATEREVRFTLAGGIFSGMSQVPIYVPQGEACAAMRKSVKGRINLGDLFAQVRLREKCGR